MQDKAFLEEEDVQLDGFGVSDAPRSRSAGAAAPQVDTSLVEENINVVAAIFNKRKATKKPCVCPWGWEARITPGTVEVVTAVVYPLCSATGHG